MDLTAGLGGPEDKWAAGKFTLGVSEGINPVVLPKIWHWEGKFLNMVKGGGSNYVSPAPLDAPLPSGRVIVGSAILQLDNNKQLCENSETECSKGDSFVLGIKVFLQARICSICSPARDGSVPFAKLMRLVG